jgi:hypothetical protein
MPGLMAAQPALALCILDRLLNQRTTQVLLVDLADRLGDRDHSDALYRSAIHVGYLFVMQDVQSRDLAMRATRNKRHNTPSGFCSYVKRSSEIARKCPARH